MFKGYFQSALVVIATMLMMACGSPEVDGRYSDADGNIYKFNDGVMTVSVAGGLFEQEFPYTVDGDEITMTGNGMTSTYIVTDYGIENPDNKNEKYQRLGGNQ